MANSFPKVKLRRLLGSHRFGLCAVTRLLREECEGSSGICGGGSGEYSLG